MRLSFRIMTECARRVRRGTHIFYDVILAHGAALVNMILKVEYAKISFSADFLQKMQFCE